MTPDTTPERHQPARGYAHRLLRIPLFYKILIANAAIVLISTVGSALVTRTILLTSQEFQLRWVVLMVVGSLLATIFVNAVILRLALSPLKALEETAAEIQRGNLYTRVPQSSLRDVELERLTTTFNGMLDTLESYRVRLSGVAVRALNAEEQERKRIARELHDDTAQTLAALLIRLRLLRAIDDHGSREQMIEQFREEIGEALERVRRFARGLRPPALEELGLVPAIESHVRSLSESVGINIRVEADAIEDMLSHSAELALYRIAQEAISNAVRHAEPGKVVVRIQRNPDSVALTVTDDGRGFVVEQKSTSDDSGLGLFGMQERAAYFGGHVYVTSTPGSGTRVQAVIPASDASVAEGDRSHGDRREATES